MITKIDIIELIRREVMNLKLFVEKKFAVYSNDLYVYLDGKFDDINKNLSDKKKLERQIDQLTNIILEKDKIIETLATDEFMDSETIDTIYIKPYRHKPIVVKDGKRLETDRAAYITLRYDGNGTNVEIETV